MSNEPLREYCDCLRAFATKTYKEVNSDTSGMNIDHVGQLIELDWLSAVDASSYDGKAYLNVRINPVGAAVLAEWEGILRASSIGGKLLANAEKLGWLVIGALLALIPQLILR